MPQETSITNPPNRKFAVARVRAETAVVIAHDEKDARLTAEWVLPLETTFAGPEGSRCITEDNPAVVAVFELFTCAMCGYETPIRQDINYVGYCTDAQACTHRAGLCNCKEMNS